METTRTCIACKQSLTESSFYKGGRNDCKECRKRRVEARRQQLRSEHLCIECRTPVGKGPLCEKCKETHRNRYHENREQYGEKSKQRRRRLKMAALSAYGGPICSCCGEQHVEFLTIDHIEKNGADHRRELLAERGWNVDSRSMSGSHMYLWLKQNGYPPGFRVLCFNCNFSMGHFGYCPHTQ